MRIVRRSLPLAGVTAIVWSLLLSMSRSTTHVYLTLSGLCMTLSNAMRAHGQQLMLAAVGLLVALGVVACGSAALRAWRTSRVVRQLLATRTDDLSTRFACLLHRLQLVTLVDLVEHSHPVAFTYGLRHPRLLISTALAEMLDDGEMEAVLRHERVHLDRRDPLRILLARSLSAAVGFLPFMPGAIDAYLCRRELDADRAAVEAMNDVLSLASALDRLMHTNARVELSSLAVGALSATGVRIDRLLGINTPAAALTRSTNRLQGLTFAVAVTVGLCLLIASAHAATGIRPCIPC